MLVNMLKAVSKMLDESKEPKVQCAKVIIDEIINGQTAPVVSTTPAYGMDGESVTVYDQDLDPDAQQAKEELMS